MGDQDLMAWLMEEFHKTPSWDKPIPQEERDIFDGDVWTLWFRNNWHIPLIAIAIYVPIVFIGPSILNALDFHFKSKALTGLWSLSLSLFSMWGASILIPELFFHEDSGLLTQGLQGIICGEARWGFGRSGFAIGVFVLSKIPELFDTVLLVLAGRPVIFLHWYHHITVLLFCWHCFSIQAPIGLSFVAMNYTVHAIMYFYYFLTQLGPEMRKIIAIVKTPITILQTSQMFVGTFVCISFLVKEEEDCKKGANRMNAVLGLVMYSTYFYLFFQFLLQQCRGQNKKQKKN